jgi:hypothetical protein
MNVRCHDPLQKQLDNKVVIQGGDKAVAGMHSRVPQQGKRV